jgi:hypothetical protein
VDNFIN